jgi:hypothetical protein
LPAHDRRSAGRSCTTVSSAIHEDREEQNDRQRDADKPEQRTFSQTHDRLRSMFDWR